MNRPHLVVRPRKGHAVLPNITLSPSGTPEPVQGGAQTETSTAAKTTSTP